MLATLVLYMDLNSMSGLGLGPCGLRLGLGLESCGLRLGLVLGDSTESLM